MRRVYILPNVITAASMMCGLLAIFNVLQGDYETACYQILVAGVLDFLDGKVARLTNTSSSFGMHFDSLSDLVAFGVAPAILMFSWLTAKPLGLDERAATGVCVPFAICGALRLARFNVQAGRHESHDFTGLPIPAAAAAMVGLYFLGDSYGNLGVSDKLLARVAASFVILVAYLMVSTIHYPSLKHVVLSRRKSFDMLVAMVLLSGLIIVLKHELKILVSIAAYAYVSIGVALHVRRRVTASDGFPERSIRRELAEGPEEEE